ncbi:unnamed protein product [Ectocarpus sp. 12 AP-2014]
MAKTERLGDEARQRAQEFKEAQDPLVPLRCRREALTDEKRQNTGQTAKPISRRLRHASRTSGARLQSERQKKNLHKKTKKEDLSSVTASDTCKIIKMQPPRKGDHNQTTLEEAFGAGAS